MYFSANYLHSSLITKCMDWTYMDSYSVCCVHSAVLCSFWLAVWVMFWVFVSVFAHGVVLTSLKIQSQFLPRAEVCGDTWGLSTHLTSKEPLRGINKGVLQASSLQWKTKMTSLLIWKVCLPEQESWWLCELYSLPALTLSIRGQSLALTNTYPSCGNSKATWLIVCIDPEGNTLEILRRPTLQACLRTQPEQWLTVLSSHWG